MLQALAAHGLPGSPTRCVGAFCLQALEQLNLFAFVLANDIEPKYGLVWYRGFGRLCIFRIFRHAIFLLIFDGEEQKQRYCARLVATGGGSSVAVGIVLPVQKVLLLDCRLF